MADIKKTAEIKKTVKTDFPFGRQNYILMFVGLAFLLLGFLLMIGGGSDDPNVFSPALFNFQRLTLAPLLLLAGFIIEILAIMKKPKEHE
jgi:hypothetical protein